MEEEIRDSMGQIINVGDTVLRAKHSTFTHHLVLGFTNNSLILSCERASYTYGANSDRTYIYRTNTPELQRHNSKFYFPKSYSQNGLIKHI